MSAPRPRPTSAEAARSDRAGPRALPRLGAAALVVGAVLLVACSVATQEHAVRAGTAPPATLVAALGEGWVEVEEDPRDPPPCPTGEGSFTYRPPATATETFFRGPAEASAVVTEVGPVPEADAWRIARTARTQGEVRLLVGCLESPPVLPRQVFLVGPHVVASTQARPAPARDRTTRVGVARSSRAWRLDLVGPDLSAEAVEDLVAALLREVDEAAPSSPAP